MQSRIKTGTNDLTEIPRTQRRSIEQPINHYVENYIPAKKRMRKPFETGDYTMEIATAFSVHYSTVCRATKNNSRKILDCKT